MEIPLISTSTDRPRSLSAWNAQAESEQKGIVNPSAKTKLQLCLLNMQTIKSGFPHNSLLWLPVSEEDGKECWYPVRIQLKWRMCIPPLGVWGQWIAQFLLDRHNVEFVPIRIPLCSKTILLQVDASLEVKQKIEEYERHEDYDPEKVKEGIKKLTMKTVEEAVAEIKNSLPRQLENIRKQHDKRLRYGLKRIEKDFKEDRLSDHNKILETTSDCEELLEDLDFELPHLHLSDCVADVACAMGHSAEKDYKGQGYEELYLTLHSLMYFSFFAVMFCLMLAFSSYALMQFFFMFLLRQTDEEQKQEGNKGLIDETDLSPFRYFCYFFLIPYLLMGVSVVGFQVMLLIRSTVRTPQISRGRALMVGFFMLIWCRIPACPAWCPACRIPAWSSPTARIIVEESKKKSTVPSFWSVLKIAMGGVDTWFTIGMDFFLVLGSMIAAIHAQANGYDSYEKNTWQFYLLVAFVCLVITLALLLVFSWLSTSAQKQGRMLNWKLGQTSTFFSVVWAGMFICITNPTTAYEGVVFGGVLWAIFTSGLYILSDACLDPKQRELMTLLEMCLDDRRVSAGRMQVRFYEIKNRMQQQLEIWHEKPNQPLEKIFPVNEKDQPKTAYVAVFFVLLNIPLYFAITTWSDEDPMLIVLGILVLDALFLTVLVTFEKSKKQKEKGETWSYPKNLNDVYGWFPATFMYLAFANFIWIATFFLSEKDQDNPQLIFFIVVFAVAGLLLHATGSPLSPLMVTGFTILPWALTKEQGEETLFKSLQAAYPALLLIPVMMYWHNALLRRMPSLSHGAAKSSINRRLFDFNGYHALMLFYSLGSVLLFLTGTVIAQAPTEDGDVGKMGMYHVHGTGDYNKPHGYTYPVCKMTWGPPGLDLTVLDLAILSKYAYADNLTTTKHGIATSFGREEGFSNVEVVNVTDFNSIPRMVTTKFISGRNVTTYVVAFKGTSTPTEAFADGSLYSGVAFVGFLSQLIDIFDLVPNTMIGFLLNHMRLRPIQRIEDRILEEATEHIQSLRNKDRNSHIVITGHSLGGGFASAIAGIAEHDAITFSAPGTHFNRFVFRTNFVRAWRNVVNVWPDSDLVPLVDRHDDMVQRIECRDPATGKHPGHVTCHLITTTICELWRVCGDRHARHMTLCTDSSLNYTSFNDTEGTWGKYITPANGTVGRRFSYPFEGEIGDSASNQVPKA